MAVSGGLQRCHCGGWGSGEGARDPGERRPWPVTFRVGTTAGDDDHFLKRRSIPATTRWPSPQRGDDLSQLSTSLPRDDREQSTRSSGRRHDAADHLGRQHRDPDPEPQSLDVMFVVRFGNAPQKIERRGSTSWSVTYYRTDDGPFRLLSRDADVKITSSATEGTSL